MSDRRARAMLALSLLVALAPEVVAQDDGPRLRAELTGLQGRAAEAESVFRRLNRRQIEPMDTTYVAELGIRVYVANTKVDPEEAQSVVQGMRDGVEALERRFGRQGRTLVDSATWQVTSWYRGVRAIGQPLVVSAGQGASRMAWELNRPVRPSDVARFVEARAAERLAYRSPVLSSYAGYGFGLVSSHDRLAEVAREMSVSASTTMRRCIGGSIPDCRRLLSQADSADRFRTWYEPAESWLAVNFSAGAVSTADTARSNLRRRCLDGAAADCTQLVGRMTVRPPYSSLVRFTLVAHALEVGQASMLDSLVDRRGGDALAQIANAAGVPLDSLIAGWQRRAAAALAAERPNPFPVILLTTGWSILLAGVATRGRRMP